MPGNDYAWGTDCYMFISTSSCEAFTRSEERFSFQFIYSNIVALHRQQLRQIPCAVHVSSTQPVRLLRDQVNNRTPTQLVYLNKPLPETF